MPAWHQVIAGLRERRIHAQLCVDSPGWGCFRPAQSVHTAVHLPTSLPAVDKHPNRFVLRCLLCRSTSRVLSMKWCQVSCTAAICCLHYACLLAASAALLSRCACLAQKQRRQLLRPPAPCPSSAGWQFLDSCNFPAQVSMEVHYKKLYMWTGLDNRDTWRCAAGGRWAEAERGGAPAESGRSLRHARSRYVWCINTGHSRGRQPWCGRQPLPRNLHHTHPTWPPAPCSPMVWPMHQLSMAELAVFFGHLADLGYAIVSREDNLPWVSCQAQPQLAGCCWLLAACCLLLAAGCRE